MSNDTMAVETLMEYGLYYHLYASLSGYLASGLLSLSIAPVDVDAEQLTLPAIAVSLYTMNPTPAEIGTLSMKKGVPMVVQVFARSEVERDDLVGWVQDRLQRDNSVRIYDFNESPPPPNGQTVLGYADVLGTTSVMGGLATAANVARRHIGAVRFSLVFQDGD